MLTPLIAMPNTGNICTSTVQSLVCLNPVPDFIAPESSLITKSRNWCVQTFMAGDWSHLFFIDSDVGFKPETFARVLVASGDRHVAAGIYPMRHDNLGERQFHVTKDEIGPIAENGFAEAVQAPTGFMCIPRMVLRAMLEKYGANEIFDTMYDRERDVIIGEDYAFCRRWTALGGTIYVDTRSTLTHQGYKTYCKGNLEADG